MTHDPKRTWCDIIMDHMLSWETSEIRKAVSVVHWFCFLSLDI